MAVEISSTVLRLFRLPRSPGRRVAGTVPKFVAFGARVFWFLAAVSHLPALLRLWQMAPTGGPAAGGVGQSAGLTLAVIFCALKAADVRFLRIRPCWRARLGLLLALVLAHAGVISEFDQQTSGLEAILSFGGSVTVLWMYCRPAVSNAGRRLATRASVELERAPFPANRERHVNPILEYVLPAYAGPRAPPRA